MADKNFTQALDTIHDASRIVIALPQILNVDIFATAIGLATILKAQNKEVRVLTSGAVPATAAFLMEGITIETSLAKPGLDIVVSTEHATPDAVSYDLQADGLHITVNAKTGSFTEDDVHVNHPSSAADLVIIIGAESLEDLGALYQQSPDLFFNTPSIVFDIQPDNTYFGTTNVVDVTAASLAELIGGMYITEPEHLTPQASTAFLTGLTSATQSFQSPRTTPRSLILAADLVTHGADQQAVVKALYKTKPFPLLKLWGRALARVQSSDSPSALYSIITQNDYAKTETTPSLVPEVLTELVETSAGAHVIALIAETDEEIMIALATLPHINPQTIAEKLHARIESSTLLSGAYTRTILHLSIKDSAEAEKQFLEAIQ